MDQIRQTWQCMLHELGESIQPKKGQLLVVGCSTSEVIGRRIGSAGSAEVAKIILHDLLLFATDKEIDLAVQCCEHLNRALVIEKNVALKKGYEIVKAVPVHGAGGSFATLFHQSLQDPVLVEHVQADYGIDIGSTLIGMHLKHVAVPIRLSVRELGNAITTFAYTRPKYIGGPRSIYDNL